MEFDPGPEIIWQYFDNLDSVQKSCFFQLGEIYEFWNQRVNLISRKDMFGFYQNHVLHSLGIAKFQQFGQHDTVLDVGTGGGFPGIPLAILFPKTQFHLIDSIGKKIKVVQFIIDKLELENVTCEQVRAEQLEGRYDFVVTRAVARLSLLINWVRSSAAPGCKLLCLKGGDLAEEINETRSKVHSFNLSDYYQELFFETKKLLVIKV
jgi:16S rRNA (guanine527-N7)-methyltransferase